jgi:D-arabinono-1,4-lactone oxidase
VEDITLVLADGSITTCSLEIDPDLFRAALVSLGSLGIVVRLTMRASPMFNLLYTSETISLSRFLAEYDAIWASAMYVRAWWWPYSRKVIIWRGDQTQSPPSPVPQSSLAQWFSSSIIEKTFYQSSLYALRYKPSLIPAFERLHFRKKFPAPENVISEPLVGKSHGVLQMDCLFSQYVDEWAIPLSSGVEAICRLDRWITHHDTSESGIPVDGKVFVHAPIEIRVSSGGGDHAFLSPAREGTPVVWIGTIMYRPFFTPTAYRRYFTAYEHLMRSLGGKPHWAKQHGVTAAHVEGVFGEGMRRWLQVRARVDSQGVFVNGFVKRHLLGIPNKENLGVGVLDGEAGRLHKRYNSVL